MKNKLLLGFLLYCYTASAQQWLWSYPVHSDGASQIMNVAADSSGNGYVMGGISGHSTFFGLNDSVGVDGLNSFVSKFDRYGNLAWVSGARGNFGMNNNPMNGGFALDNAGNSYLTGSFHDTAWFGNNSDTIQTVAPGNSKGILAKLDSDGKAVYAKQYNDPKHRGIIIGATPSGELVHSGYYSIPADTNFACYLKKSEAATGNDLWTLPGNATLIATVGSAIVPTNDGGFLLNAAYGYDSTVFHGLHSSVNIPATAGWHDVYMVKYTLSGEVLWGKKVGGVEYDWCRGITVDGDNNIIFAVESRSAASYDGIPLLPKGERTLHLIKTDPSGNYVNHISFNAGTYMHFWLNDLKSDRHGNIYLCAKMDTTQIIGSDTLFYNSDPLNQRISIMKFDAGMNYLWSQYMSGYCNCGGSISVADSIIYFAMNHDGSVSLNGTGYTYTAPTLTHTSFVAGLRNSELTTKTDEKVKETTFSVYPNPGTGLFTIEVNGEPSSGSQLQVFDMMGNCVQQSPATLEKTLLLNLESLPKGVYFVELKASRGIVVKKVVLQ